MTRRRYALIVCLCIVVALMILLGCVGSLDGIDIDARATHDASEWAERMTRTAKMKGR